ncbi:MAG: hypothetical protein KDK70_18320 [Myxococcales bacterium]|nr:hypothetical protein [Myxococcales bacterium]
MAAGRHRVAWGVMLAIGCGGDPGDEGSGDGSATVATAPTSVADGTTMQGSGGRDSGDTRPDTGPAETGQPDSSGDGFHFDVGASVDAPPAGCECGQASEFSYIFIANSPESTVSKIDTQTVTEVGRYLTRSDASGNPSRTSVSISGRAVAVANRHAGLIKIFTNEEDCIDANGNGVIDTSTGAADVLPWGQDECVHWYRDFQGMGWTVQRPVAWAPGTFDAAQCRWEDEAVWTAGCGGGSPGFGGDTTTHVHLIDGETGVDLQVVDLPDYSCQGFGPYGGAVDSAGNFWLLQNNGNLARVNRSDFTHQVWGHSPNTAPYGLTVDASGRPWVTSYSASIGAARFDPATETWAEAPDPVLVGNGQSGIAQGADGLVWMGVNAPGGLGVASIDPETLVVVDVYAVPGVSGKGISVDGEGYVWRAGWTTATKIDPSDGSSSAYSGLNQAYTYSDMTGFGVANASGCNPAG